MTYYYAQIDAARIVVGVTQVAAPVEAEHMLPLDELDISILGKRHDTETGAFVDVPVAPATPLRHISPLAFRRRFTKAERAAIEWAAVDRPELSDPQRMQAAALRSDLKDQEQAKFMDLDDPDVAEGVQTLEALGLLQPGRASQIISAAIEAGELL